MRMWEEIFYPSPPPTPAPFPLKTPPLPFYYLLNHKSNFNQIFRVSQIHYFDRTWEDLFNPLLLPPPPTH